MKYGVLRDKNSTVSTARSIVLCSNLSKLISIFHFGNFCFQVPLFKQLLLRKCAVDVVEICKVYVGQMIIKADKRIFNSDKICHNYSDYILRES